MKVFNIAVSLFFLVLTSFPPVQAQTAANVPGGSNATATPAPTARAPDEMTKKIAELVHAGKYPEAQQLTTGLLVAYPNDQRLIKAKALIEKLLSPAGSASATPSSSQPARPALNASAAQLSGMDKVEYNSLIELARQAQQTTDLEQQNALLKQFMDKSHAFLLKHPDQMLLWQLRAASAISLNDPMAGYEAGQKLIAAGAADSGDPNLQRLLAQLNSKGWLDKQKAEEAKEQQRYILVTVTLVDDADAASRRELRSKLDSAVTALLQSRFPRTNIRTTTPDAGPDPVLRVTINLPYPKYWFEPKGGFSHRYTGHVNSTLSISVLSPIGLLVDRTFAVAIVKSNLKDADIGDGVQQVEHMRDWVAQEALEKLKGLLAEDAVHSSLGNSTPEPALPDAHSSAPMGNPAPEPTVAAVHSSTLADNPAPPAAGSNTTVLHVYRPHHLTGASQKPYIYVDGKQIVPIANSQTIRMILSPGKHNISVSKKYVNSEIPIYDLDMASGNEYWIRVELSAGAWGAHSKLFVVPTEQAQSESNRMEEIRIGDVPMNQR
jgi:hypothetical protein